VCVCGVPALAMGNDIDSVIYRSHKSIIVIWYSFLLSWYAKIRYLKPQNDHEIKTFIDWSGHIIILVCIIHWAIWICTLIYFGVALYAWNKQCIKWFILNFPFYHLIYYRDKLSYHDKNIMIINTIVKSLSHTTSPPPRPLITSGMIWCDIEPLWLVKALSVSLLFI